MKIKCPNCGSKNIWKTGFVIKRSGKSQRYQCKDCGMQFQNQNRK